MTALQMINKENGKPINLIKNALAA
jgi:hypothetical protein